MHRRSQGRMNCHAATGSARCLNRALSRVCGHTLSHGRPRTRTLLLQHMRRRAQHAPSPALSHEQADTCVVAVKVECTVAYAAGHRLRTRPGSRVFCVCADASVAAWAASHVHVNALTATQEQTRAARVLARNVSRTCGHTRRRSQGRMPCVGVEAGVAVEATRFTRTD